MNRDEHLAWCRERALEYLNRGDYQNAVTSMLSDLAKHREWADSPVLSTMALLYMVSPTIDTARRIINGFN
jgi:Tfp pilus assembly protein PilF